MPIYEYECTSCHHHFEIIQKVSDEPIKKCDQCLQDTVVRLVSAAGFQLKGSGWYATDFKSKPKKENSGSPEGQKTDKKPAETVSSAQKDEGK